MDTIDQIYNTMEHAKPDVAPERQQSRVIGSLQDGRRCPCCNVQTNQSGRQTLNGEPHHCNQHLDENEQRPASEEDCREYDSDDSYEERREDDLEPGVLANGVPYVPTQVLVEGWLEKKGTGKDFFGSRKWKRRYARLVVSLIGPSHTISQLGKSN